MTRLARGLFNLSVNFGLSLGLVIASGCSYENDKRSQGQLESTDQEPKLSSQQTNAKLAEAEDFCPIDEDGFHLDDTRSSETQYYDGDKFETGKTFSAQLYIEKSIDGDFYNGDSCKTVEVGFQVVIKPQSNMLYGKCKGGEYVMPNGDGLFGTFGVGLQITHANASWETKQTQGIGGNAFQGISVTSGGGTGTGESFAGLPLEFITDIFNSNSSSIIMQGLNGNDIDMDTLMNEKTADGEILRGEIIMLMDKFKLLMDAWIVQSEYSLRDLGDPTIDQREIEKLLLETQTLIQPEVPDPTTPSGWLQMCPATIAAPL